MQALYTARAHATGGREGSAASDNGAVDVTLTTPKELGGNGAPGANPEQLFAAGYAACFHSALNMVAKDKGADVTDSAVGARVTLNNGSEGFFISVELEVTIPSVDKETAQALADAAHEACPYSKATRGNIDVTVTVAQD